MLTPMKVVEVNAGALVNAIYQNESQQKCSTERGKFKDKYAQSKERANCGRPHDVSIRESYHA